MHCVLLRSHSFSSTFNIDHSSFDQLEKSMLNTFSRHISVRWRMTFMSSSYLYNLFYTLTITSCLPYRSHPEILFLVGLFLRFLQPPALVSINMFHIGYTTRQLQPGSHFQHLLPHIQLGSKKYNHT